MAGGPLFKETVSSLTQPPETSSCETWFYQPSACLLLASVVFLLGVSIGFFRRTWSVQVVGPGWDKRKLHLFCTACPRMEWMEKNKRLMSSTGSASLASWVGTREDVKCIALEQNVPFTFACDSNIKKGLDVVLCSWISVHPQPTSNLCLSLSWHTNAQKHEILSFSPPEGIFFLARASSPPSLTAISAFCCWGCCCLCSYNSPFQRCPGASIPPEPSPLGAVGRRFRLGQTSLPFPSVCLIYVIFFKHLGVSFSAFKSM